MCRARLLRLCSPVEVETGKTKDKSGLPALPIPALEDTCKRFIAVAEPLLTADEAKAMRADVDAFLASDGPRLQEQLKRWTSVDGERSYIERCAQGAGCRRRDVILGGAVRWS